MSISIKGKTKQSNVLQQIHEAIEANQPDTVERLATAHPDVLHLAAGANLVDLICTLHIQHNIRFTRNRYSKYPSECCTKETCKVVCFKLEETQLYAEYEGTLKRLVLDIKTMDPYKDHPCHKKCAMCVSSTGYFCTRMEKEDKERTIINDDTFQTTYDNYKYAIGESTMEVRDTNAWIKLSPENARKLKSNFEDVLEAEFKRRNSEKDNRTSSNHRLFIWTVFAMNIIRVVLNSWMMAKVWKQPGGIGLEFFSYFGMCYASQSITFLWLIIAWMCAHEIDNVLTFQHPVKRWLSNILTFVHASSFALSLVNVIVFPNNYDVALFIVVCVVEGITWIAILSVLFNNSDGISTAHHVFYMVMLLISMTLSFLLSLLKPIHPVWWNPWVGFLIMIVLVSILSLTQKTQKRGTDQLATDTTDYIQV